MKKNILHIIDSLGLGGAQFIVKGFFESCSENKNIFLFSLRKREINIKVNHQNVCIFDSDKKYSFKPIKELIKYIKDNQIEILHCHLFKSQFFGLLLKIFYFPKIKLIFHEHGQIFQKSFYYKHLMRFSKKWVDLFLAVSYATEAELIKKSAISKEKIKNLHNFIDLDKFDRKKITLNILEEKKKLGIKNNEFIIGFVGRFAKVKGCEYLIKSLPYLDFDYKCLIAGDGELRNNLEQLAKTLKVDDKVIFLGYQKDVLKIYPLIDVLVMPSKSEASPMAFYEAQALGVPIIGSNVSAINEFVLSNKNGLLFEFGNSKELAEKVRILYANKILKNMMGKYAIKNIQKFSLKKYLNNLNNIYKEL